MKYDIRFNDYENLKISHLELRTRYNNYKKNYDELLKVNIELKEKLIDNEKGNILHQEDFKSMIKKNSFLLRKVDV